MGTRFTLDRGRRYQVLAFALANCLMGSSPAQQSSSVRTYEDAVSLQGNRPALTSGYPTTLPQLGARRAKDPVFPFVKKQPTTSTFKIKRLRLPGPMDAPMYPRYPEEGDVPKIGIGTPANTVGDQFPPRIPKVEFDKCTAAVRSYSVNMQDASLRETYAIACLESKLPNGLADVDLATAGIRVTGSSQPFCSGVIIKPGVFLTARHCFFNQSNGTKRYEWELLEQGKLEIVSGLSKLHSLACAASDQDRKTPAVALCSSRSARTMFDIDEDKIVLNIPSLGNEFEGMRVGSPAAGTELLVYAYFEALEKRHFSKFSCNLTSVKGKCALHVCQASHSSSGGPLFFKNSQNELLVGGIHIGKAEESLACGLQGGEQVNVGVLVLD